MKPKHVGIAGGLGLAGAVGLFCLVGHSSGQHAETRQAKAGEGGNVVGSAERRDFRESTQSTVADELEEFDLENGDANELEQAASHLSDIRAQMYATDSGRERHAELEGRVEDAFARL